MINFLRSLSRPKYDSLNRIEIIADNILYNYRYLSFLRPEAEIFPVLKANAYGHGLKEVCRILNRSQAKMVAVDSFPEAQIVYRNFKGKVLILEEMPLPAYRYCNFRRTEFCVYNSSTIKYLATKHPGVKIHLFLNSGMNREGLKDVKTFIDQNKEYLKHLVIKGICSHLASAEEETEQQENTFLSMIDYLKEQGIKGDHIHIGNSAGIFTTKNKAYNAFRAGLALYGYGYGSENLKPALRLISKIVAICDVLPGEIVSYGRDYVIANKTRLALIPFGYYEGLDRRLSAMNLGFRVKGQEVAIAGKVSMNLTVLDIFNNQDINIGDEVELVSLDSSAKNSVNNIAAAMGTIPYEFLVKLQANIRRLII